MKFIQFASGILSATMLCTLHSMQPSSEQDTKLIVAKNTLVLSEKEEQAKEEALKKERLSILEEACKGLKGQPKSKDFLGNLPPRIQRYIGRMWLRNHRAYINSQIKELIPALINHSFADMTIFDSMRNAEATCAQSIAAHVSDPESDSSPGKQRTLVCHHYVSKISLSLADLNNNDQSLSITPNHDNAFIIQGFDDGSMSYSLSFNNRKKLYDCSREEIDYMVLLYQARLQEKQPNKAKEHRHLPKHIKDNLDEHYFPSSACCTLM